MIDPANVKRDTDALRDLAGEKFSFKAETLEKAMRKVGRRVPKYVQREAQVLIDAEQVADHPKLSRMLDADRITKAERIVRQGLEAVDPADRRKGMILSILGSIAFGLLVTFTILVVVLRWRGFV